MKKVTSILFVIGLFASLSLTSCKDKCTTCTYEGLSDYTICEDESFYNTQITSYELSGYECTED